VYDYTTTIEGCSFFDNAAPGRGGGVSLSRSSFAIVNCLFVRNSVTGNGLGGAVSAGPPSGGTGTIAGCTFHGNTQQWTTNGGAAVFLETIAGAATYQFNSNVLSASAGTEAVEVYGGGTMVNSCNVYWNNAAGDVQGFTLDPTDRIADPMFCDPTLDDYTLNEASPCLPANSPGCGQIGAFGQGCGAVSVEAMSWARIKALYGR
jgi:hypothetical protein